MSASLSRPKVTFSEYRPLPVDCESMYSMPSTPFTLSSTTCATLSRTTSALAPMYWVDTLIVGNLIRGYWAMGSTANASRPLSVMNRESTMANTGRSMKKRAMILPSTVRRRGSGFDNWRCQRHRLHLRAGTHLVVALHDHLILILQAFVHHHFIAVI